MTKKWAELPRSMLYPTTLSVLFDYSTSYSINRLVDD